MYSKVKHLRLFQEAVFLIGSKRFPYLLSSPLSNLPLRNSFPFGSARIPTVRWWIQNPEQAEPSSRPPLSWWAGMYHLCPRTGSIRTYQLAGRPTHKDLTDTSRKVEWKYLASLCKIQRLSYVRSQYFVCSINPSNPQWSNNVNATHCAIPDAWRFETMLWRMIPEWVWLYCRPKQVAH